MSRIMRHPPFFAIVAVFLALILVTSAVGAFAFWSNPYGATVHVSTGEVGVYWDAECLNPVGDNQTLDFGVMIEYGQGEFSPSDEVVLFIRSEGDVPAYIGAQVSGLIAELELRESDVVVPSSGWLGISPELGLNDVHALTFWLEAVGDAPQTTKQFTILLEADSNPYP